MVKHYSITVEVEAHAGRKVAHKFEVEFDGTSYRSGAMRAPTEAALREMCRRYAAACYA